MAETAEGGTEVGSGGEVGESQSSFPGAVFKSSLCHFLSSPPLHKRRVKLRRANCQRLHTQQSQGLKAACGSRTTD